MKQVKQVKRFFRELFCRHEMGLIADWSPDEICIYAACPKCGKIYGHFHIPSIPPKVKERIH